jgi:P27 family predicted phage terminase small subunit
MAKRGPKPKPPRPTPLVGRPDRPAGLDTEAARHWDEVAEMIEAAGLLSRLDGDAMGIYIDAWMRYRQAKVKGKAAGWVMDTPHGPRKTPWYGVMQDAVRVMRECMDRFGLNPRARQRLKIEPVDTEADGKWAGFGVVD